MTDIPYDLLMKIQHGTMGCRLDRRAGACEIDRSLCDDFGRNVTLNVDGYLRRVA